MSVTEKIKEPDHVAPRQPKRTTTFPMESGFATMGEIARFGGQTILGVPTAIRHYPTEIIRQAAVMVMSSSLVLWVFTMVIGMEAALLGSYMLGSLGAGDYIGLFIAVAAIQAVSSPTFGWIFSAKVGCGYTAELGTMRISEEIDALQVMGIEPRSYLASTRLLAVWLVVPFLWLVSTGLMMVGAWFIADPLMHTASPGGYSDVFWSFQKPTDLFLALFWSMATCTAVAIVSCYFGFTASGGPVGVGRATARSMLVNMVLVSVFTGIFYQLFFGVFIRLPIAN